MKVYLESLGCRLNAAEIETLARCFAGAGWEVQDAPDEADVIVLNTCAVTATAARKSRHRLRTLHRRYPLARLAVIGCWVTEQGGAIHQFPYVSWFFPNAEKERVIEVITGERRLPAPWSPGRWGHTRAYLAVQEGCDHACTYCLTRVLRGPARSRPFVDALNQARHLVAQGAQEIVLTGVSLGAYGRDLGLQDGLATLVRAILEETPLPRLRLSSVEPWDVTPALLRLLGHPRFCRHLHLPLQSGDDTVLKRMGRPYTTAHFARLLAEARAVAPDVAITTDLIVGFPGETEAAFKASLDFVERMAFARLHVFPYSARKGTAAARFPNQVPKAVRIARAARMRALGEQLSQAYRSRFLGRVLPVLWEQRNGQGWWQGFTDNYLRVTVRTSQELYNRLIAARLLEVREKVIIGELQNTSQPHSEGEN